MFTRNKVAIAVVLVVVGVVFIAADGKKSTQAPTFQTAVAERGTIVTTIDASGKLLSTNTATVTTGASGVIKHVFVREGDVVKIGQKLAEISLDQMGQQKNAQAWSSYLLAKNSLDSAKTSLYTLQSAMLTQWKTYMDTAQSGTYQNSDGSPKAENRTLPQFYSLSDDWLATEAKYKNQQAVINQSSVAVNSSWLSYQQTSPMITAPMAGTIAGITVAEGMVVGNADSTATSQQRVAVISGESQPLVSVNLTELDVLKVKIDQKVTITFDSIADKTFTGVVVAVDRMGTTTSSVTNYPVLIRLDTGTTQMLPNMAVSARIISDTKTDVIVVPSAAVQVQGTASSVRLLRSGKEESVPVEVGISSGTDTEIISGISVGDMVITGSATTATPATNGRSLFGGGGVGGAGVFRAGGFGGGGQRR